MEKERKISKPSWLVDFKKRIGLIEIIDKCFDLNCDCEVCSDLREFSKEMGEYFELPHVPELKKEKR